MQALALPQDPVAVVAVEKRPFVAVQHRAT
jgi:hypothetical protein